MTTAIRRFLCMCLVMLFLSACSGDAQDQNGPIQAITLLPYSTPTQPRVQIQATSGPQSVTATPQPETYTVVAGDSLLAIAFRYGMDVTTLMNANPGVNPNAMSIGTKLIIPAVDGASKNTPNLVGLPTPVIQTSSNPDCYQTSTVDWICFLLVTNDQSGPIESIMGSVVSLADGTEYSAISPVDVLYEGDSVPLIASIGQATLDSSRLTGSLRSALPLPETQDRYAPVELGTPEIEYTDDLRSANIHIVVGLPAGGKLRLVAYALGDQGQVLGYRVWDASEPAATGQTIELRFILYSLGGSIANIQFTAQSRLK